MRISLNWLKDLVDIDGDAHRVAEVLTGVGLEVESVRAYAPPAGVATARVREVRAHPDADKLRVCTVEAGSGKHEVVCGAPNVREGMIAAFAPAGTTVASGMTVDTAVIRGVTSSGMLCSERELGLSEDHSGIMELDAGTEIGRPLSDIIPADWILDIELTPDRGDCLSMLGVARELAAAAGTTIRETAAVPHERDDDPIGTHADVRIDAPAKCPRYAGRLVRGVTVGPSPQWLKNRLRTVGLRPINNVVDITNYILLHFGHPMHAFDFKQIKGGRISVRTAGEGMVFVTLDEQERTLTAEDLLICDDGGPLALAGIMGGAGSAVTEETTDIFLECAFFDPSGVRRTSKRLGLSTDSSYRFERGVDPGDGLVRSLDTAAALTASLAGGTVCAGRIDRNPQPCTRPAIPVRISKAAELLGTDLNPDTTAKLLRALLIEVDRADNDTLTCTVPTWRHDLHLEVDMIEEIGRMHGYDNIQATSRTTLPLRRSENTREATTGKIRASLAHFGLNEIVTGGLCPEATLRLIRPDIQPVALMNPISPDLACLRTTMVAGLLQTVVYNLNRRTTDNRLFELGKVFRSRGRTHLPLERTHLAIVIQGAYQPPAWNHGGVPSDFFVLKGILDALAVNLEIGSLEYGPGNDPLFDRESASVHYNDKITGSMGRLNSEIGAHFDTDTALYYAELDVTEFLDWTPSAPRYRDLPKFPAVERDFAFVLPESINSASISEEIFGLSSLVEAVVPFDVYRGEKVEEGMKSIAWSVRLRSPERTLTDEAAQEVCDAIIETVSSKYGARLRQ